MTFNFVDTSVSDRSRICPRYVQNMYHICPKYISDMSQIGPRYVPNMFKTCPRYVPEYLIVCPSLEKVWISWTSPSPQRDDGRRPTHNPNIELSIYVQSMAGLGRIGKSGVQQLLSTLLCVCVSVILQRKLDKGVEWRLLVKDHIPKIAKRRNLFFKGKEFI